MNILITGANGFIGKHLSKYLEKNSFNITRVIRNKIEDQKNIINIHPMWDIQIILKKGYIFTITQKELNSQEVKVGY